MKDNVKDVLNTETMKNTQEEQKTEKTEIKNAADKAFKSTTMNVLSDAFKKGIGIMQKDPNEIIQLWVDNSLMKFEDLVRATASLEIISLKHIIQRQKEVDKRRQENYVKGKGDSIIFKEDEKGNIKVQQKDGSELSFSLQNTDLAKTNFSQFKTIMSERGMKIESWEGSRSVVDKAASHEADKTAKITIEEISKTMNVTDEMKGAIQEIHKSMLGKKFASSMDMYYPINKEQMTHNVNIIKDLPSLAFEKATEMCASYEKYVNELSQSKSKEKTDEYER